MTQYPSTPPSMGPNTPAYGGTPGLAIAALVCGILAFCVPLLGIVAVIMGVMFLSQTRDGRPGRGMAMAGTICGGCGLVINILLVIAILLPALGAARRTAQRMENSTQLRGIHQGLVTFANSNKNNYPGLTSSGDIWSDGPMTGNSGEGNTPQARIWILLDGGFITPEYLISPSETEPIMPYLGGGPVTEDNYSYALLSFEETISGRKDGRTGEYVYDVDSATYGRAAEWSQTLNSQAIVLSDRNIGSNASSSVTSIHEHSPGSWRGSVLWNDNHVGFETSHFFETKYANGSLNYGDNIFEDDGTGGFDAVMDWE